jgi:PAS domain S-box-containing protein
LEDEGWRIRKDGSRFWANVVITAIKDENGRLVSFAKLTKDLTERKRTEEQLRKSEQQFHALFDEAAVGIALVNSAGHPFESNRKLQQMLGFSAKELRALSFPQFTDPDDAQLDANLFVELVGGKRDHYEIEKRFYRKDGSLVWGHLTVSLVRNDRNEPVFGIAVVEDISRRKRAEEELERLSGRILQLQDLERRRIARNLHDSTAQVLVALLGALDELGTAIPSSARTARKLLSDCSALAHQSVNELRRLSYLLHPPLLDEMGVEDAIRHYVKGFAKRSKIRVKVSLPQHKERLTQDVELTVFRLVQESLTNIHRHSGSRTARVSISRDPSRITLEVGDQGRGIPPGTLEESNGSAGRTGIGIASMRERVKQVGGRLEINSSSKGTTLRATIPLSGASR